MKMSAKAKYEYIFSFCPAFVFFFSLLLLAPCVAQGQEKNEYPEYPAAAEHEMQDINLPVQTPAYPQALVLLEGKKSLDSGDSGKAAALLTESCEKLPILCDYALFWRAKAYEKAGEAAKAAEDLNTLTEKYKDSPLFKKAMLEKIEALKKRNDPSVVKLYENLVKGSPNNIKIKYEYAAYLKEAGEAQKAKELFKEVYIYSTNHLSQTALKELSPDDITVDDLLKRGKSLNASWLFGDSEKCFREALRRGSGNLRDEILNGLAYSLFRQKRYRESADIYGQIKNIYLRARSVFRSGDMNTFESEMEGFHKTGDRRFASLFLAHGMKKRRDGNIEEALRIFNETMSRYPSAGEDALWSMGWTYYLSRDYANASQIFRQLHSEFGDSKYLYWYNKSRKMSGGSGDAEPACCKDGVRDFYAFLSLVKNNRKPPVMEKREVKISLNSSSAERAGILASIGFKQEAVSELLQLSRNVHSQSELLSISSYLQRLGSYNQSMNIISKIPYREDLHSLFYPLGYWREVEDASKKKGLDPYLILSVIREESRFASDARSIAGAMGLMQLMPATASKLNKHAGANLKRKEDLYNPKTNILLGSYYLKQLINRFGSVPLALAAYNGGEEIVEEWLKKGNYLSIDEFIEDIPYNETKNYVKKVLTSYFEYVRSSGDIDISLTRTHLGGL